MHNFYHYFPWHYYSITKLMISQMFTFCYEIFHQGSYMLLSNISKNIFISGRELWNFPSTALWMFSVVLHCFHHILLSLFRLDFSMTLFNLLHVKMQNVISFGNWNTFNYPFVARLLWHLSFFRAAFLWQLRHNII